MNKLPSREQAVNLLKKYGCSSKVIAHCKAVAKLALETGHILQQKGQKVNLNLVEAGALLHDLGRSKTHSVNHAVAGAEIARAESLPQQVIAIIERHVGGGISSGEAKTMGWPDGNYFPETLEEKIVSYADKLIDTSERVSIELTVNRLRKEKLDKAADRVQKLHDEIATLVEGSP